MLPSAYGGTEDDVETNPGGIAHDLFGMRIGGEVSRCAQARAFASFSYQKSLYDSPTPLFGPDDRDDDYYNVGGGVRYNVTKLISIRPEVHYTVNDLTCRSPTSSRWRAFPPTSAAFLGKGSELFIFGPPEINNPTLSRLWP
ncbi:MAG: hypothetical protein U1F34_05225 [Gammaproteobacteria bacterium]